jgi:hypothetical protein
VGGVARVQEKEELWDNIKMERGIVRGYDEGKLK